MKVVENFYSKIDVLRTLKESFEWKYFEEEFKPYESSSIWKIFLLHLINKDQFPIYDQHVFRFYNFYKNGLITEILSTHRMIYESYKYDYREWFNYFKNKHRLDPKKMDESFFTFGQMLKKLKGYPLKIQRR